MEIRRLEDSVDGPITIAGTIIGIIGNPILPEKWGEKGKTLLDL